MSVALLSAFAMTAGSPRVTAVRVNAVAGLPEVLAGVLVERD